MFNEKPMPFYMSGSMSLEKERDEAMEREWRILKSWYSGEILQVQEAVERACDELDYEGSWLYDEYPDRGRMEEMQEKIQRELERDGEAAVEAEERRRRRRGDNLLKVLLSNEIFRRRCRNRNFPQTVQKQELPPAFLVNDCAGSAGLREIMLYAIDF